MHGYINYLIEVNTLMILFIAVYFLLLHRETQFKVRRAYLLGAMLASVVFPLIDLQPLLPQVATSNFMPEVYLPEMTISTESSATPSEPSRFTFWNVAGWTYASIAGLLFIRFAIRLFRLLIFLSRQSFRKDGNFNIAESDTATSTFSFFHYIVIGHAGQMEDAEKQKIIQHEKTHALRFHSFDIILTELLIIACWFNPLVYVLKNQLISVHEFEADQHTIQTTDVQTYCNMLARATLLSVGFTFVNHFNHSLTLKRIAMINMNKTKMSWWKYVAIVPVFVFGLFLLACEDKTMTEVVEIAKKSTTVTDYPKAIQDAVTALQKAHPERKFLVMEPDDAASVTKAKDIMRPLSNENKLAIQSVTALKDIKDDDGRLRSFLIIVYDERTKKIFEAAAKDGVYSAVEEAPAFPGGTNAFRLFFQQNISKDAIAMADQKNTLGGKVFVQFNVAADGSLSDFEIMKGLSPELDKEALRVAKLMPNWIPGKQNGTNVKARYSVPIQFGTSVESGNAASAIGKIAGKPLNVTYSVTKEATNRIITGKVVDPSGTPLQGAVLVVVGGTSGVMTNAEGNFSFHTMKATEQLAVSFVGYETKIISF